MSKKISESELRESGLSVSEAKRVEEAIEKTLRENKSPTEQWKALTKTVLSPKIPFEVHQKLYQAVYEKWNTEKDGPPPAWSPEVGTEVGGNLGRLMKACGAKTYEDLHEWSLSNRAKFWELMVKELGIVFKKPPAQIMDISQGTHSPRWLVGAQLNIADTCFKMGTEVERAVVYQKEGGELKWLTYGELRALASRVANGLADAGIKPGDAIAIDMSMTVESVAVYLGIVMAGCAVVSIADSFAPEEIRSRLEITSTKMIFTQDVVWRAGKSIPMYGKVTEAGAPMAVVIPWGDKSAVELRKGDLAWSDFLSSKNEFESVGCSPEAATNLLFSSGTTGDPKVIPWSHTTPIKAASDAFAHHDIQRGDVVAWPTNLGWMMGPWLIYASLMNGATIALFYGAPTTREFGAFVRDTGVKVLGLVPSIVKAWRSSGCMKGIEWKGLKLFSSTGECSNADDYLFLMSLAHYRPVIEYCGGTEVGGGFLTGTVLQPASPATFSTAALGIEVVILDEFGKPSKEGEVFLVPPSIGLSLELLNRDHYKVYFEGAPKGPDGKVLRRHGDQVEQLSHGYYRALGRADDTMNLGGIKISSAEIERVLNRVEGVLETAAIAIDPPGGGPSLLVTYVVLAPGAKRDGDELRKKMQTQISQKLNPLFKIHDVLIVDALPRTASNKVMRRSLRSAYAK
jgi:acetyl-CoA synthetase